MNTRKLTPRRAAETRKAERRRALVEGRVVRYNGGIMFRSFLTGDAADVFIREMTAQGIDAWKPSLITN